jgi:hypothetical protein
MGIWSSTKKIKKGVGMEKSEKEIKFKYEINGIFFTSKKSVIRYVQEILGHYQDGEYISQEDLEFMTSLLSYHPWSYQKIGCGISRMWIEKNEGYPTRGFWLERSDGSKTDFSFYQCLENAGLLKDFKKACRKAVAPFVIDFKNKFFKDNSNPICCITNRLINKNTSHVDHISPKTFDKILSNFIELYCIDVLKVKFTEHDDSKIGIEFLDKDLEKRWIDFHNINAELRVISAEANLRIEKKEPKDDKRD